MAEETVADFARAAGVPLPDDEDADEALPDAVTLAYVHSEEVGHNFHECLTSLTYLDAAGPGRIVRGGWIKLKCATNGLVEARNQIVNAFLRENKAEWLFWLDTDMGFAPVALEMLMAAADPVRAPIVGGLCFSWKETHDDGLGGFRAEPRATLLDWVPGEDGTPTKFMGRGWWPANAMVRVGATGCACIVVHRSVFEAIAEKWGPGSWYEKARGRNGDSFGEDVSFCMRAHALDFPVHVNTAVRTNHLKHLWVDEQDYWNQLTPPPATEEVAVLIPTLRPANAEPVMRSLRASTGLAKAYAIIGEDDYETRAAWKAAGAEVIWANHLRYPNRINIGYHATTEPWMLVGADDLRFHPGWLDQALYVASQSGANVIGTNDLGNPRVLRGEHATHSLVNRAYADEHGASWDGGGVVAHEGYRHWFVDDEIVQCARHRGTFQPAFGSKVEHLHPAWGKAANDEVYDRGSSHSDRDRVEFVSRMREFTS